jgi:inner membrane protein
MPTALTHGLVGGALVQAGPSAFPRWKVLVVLLALSILPDLDVITFLLGIPYAHPLGHRGFFHSIPFAGIVSFLLCVALFRGPELFRKKWWGLYFVLFLAAASHGLLDAATDAGLGIGLFIPFHPERIFFEFRPIRTASVDPTAFFQQRSLPVLWSEVVWVWLPLFGITAITQIVKRFYKSESKN